MRRLIIVRTTTTDETGTTATRTTVPGAAATYPTAPSTTGTYTTGQAAELSGFSIDTLRYYERIGLLPTVGRSASGRRRYSDKDLMWLKLFHCLRETGMPIAQMQRYVELTAEGKATVPARIELLEDHDRQIDEHLAALRRNQEHLRQKIAYYQAIR